MMFEETGKKSYKLQPIHPDPVHNSVVVSKFINHVMRQGKKDTAKKIVYGAFENIKEKTKRNPLEIFDLAIENVAPDMEVRSKRVGGATYQVPMKVSRKRSLSLAMRWIVGTAKSKKGKAMNVKLADELISASNSEGEAVKKKENMHKMAKANKAFAYLAK
jgi:small subunit ribosomal protein S7